MGMMNAGDRIPVSKTGTDIENSEIFECTSSSKCSIFFGEILLCDVVIFGGSVGFVFI